MNIEILFVPVQSAESFMEFAYGGDLSNVLKELGDVEVLSAIDAISKAKHSNNPDAELAAALVHLRTAHTAFRKIIDTRGIKGGMTDLWRYGYARNRAVWISLIRAVIYRHFDEQHSLDACLVDATREWNLQTSGGPIDETTGEDILGTLLYMGSGKMWIDFARNYTREKLGSAPKQYPITREEMVRFYSLLGRVFDGDTKIQNV